MNRKEAIEELKKHVKDNIKFYGQSTSGFFGEGSYYHQMLNEIIKAFEQPVSLADFLGWEEGVEYDAGIYDRRIYRVKDCGVEHFVDGQWVDAILNLTPARIEQLRQAKKVEKKLKAYHVKDEYGYNCLMKELEEQGYTWLSNIKPTEWFIWDIYKSNTVVFCEEGKTITYSELSYYETDGKSRYDLIEYHKEEPKYYAFVKDTRTWIRAGKAIKSTKSEWNKLGINDTNADFEEVGE